VSSTLVQVLISGLSLSGYYAVLAIGFAMIFSTLRIFHMAHAAVFGAAGYLFYVLYRLQHVDLWLSGIAAIVVAALFGVLIDRVIYLPVLRRGGGSFSVFIASLGVALLFESLALLFTHGALSVAHEGAFVPVTLGAVSFRWLDVEVVVTIAIVYAALYFAVMRTDAGLEIRALSDNASLAGIVGIDTKRTRTAIFLVASALAGLGGIFTTYDSGIVPTTGINLLFVTMVAVIFGGTRLLFVGTLGGSLVMGLVTALAGFLFPAWVTVIVFALLIVLLIARPQGLFG
jgi:branched-subunit amino acid ABC-type transport system permease component